MPEFNYNGEGATSSGLNNDPYVRDSNGIAVGVKPGYHTEVSGTPSGTSTIGSDGSVRINITQGVVAVPGDKPTVSPDGGTGGGGNSSGTGQFLVLNNGQMGYWEDRSTGAGNNEHITRVFVPVGPSEAEKAAAETNYQINFNSMLERARQLAQSQSVGAANTEELRANFIRDRAGFRPAELDAINAELDRATVAETAYQANYRSMLDRADQLAQSQAVGAANTEELRSNFIRDRAGFRPVDLAAINAELDRATIAEIGYQANYRSMLDRARQLAQSQAVGAVNTETLRANFIRDRAAFRPADLAAINAELDRATIAEIGYQANYRSMLERANQLARAQMQGAADTEELRANFIRDRASFRPADLEAINAELDRATIEQENIRQLRLAAANKLRSNDVQSVRGISSSTATATVPLAWAVASGGGISLGSDVAGSIWSRIAAGIAELRGIATASLAGPVAVTVAALLYSRDVGTNSDRVPGRDISSLMPGDALSLPDDSALSRAADSKAGISMPIRGRLLLSDDGLLETQLVRTPLAGTVPVFRANLDKETGYWSYTLPELPGVPNQTILISPSDAPGINGPLGISGPVPLPETFVHTGDQDYVPETLGATISPVADDLDFNDIILIFPPESGLKPLYIMLRNPRNIPGTANGNGQPVGDNWLGGAGTGDGAPIPNRIADKLRGRKFGSFDTFRKAFWKEVSADPELSKQFSADDLERMKLGRAPTVRFRDSVGKRVKVELHHKVEIYKGGDVYNVDNLNVLTPKRHIEIHKGN